MNAKATRKALNEAFKQFQRLPEWPLFRLGEGDRRAKEKREREAQFMLGAQGLATAASASQTLAE
jgi:hypothetical protein